MTAADLEKNILRDEIERLTKALHYEQHWLSRIGTCGPGCWAWGPNHYECALRKIKDAEKNSKEWQNLTDDEIKKIIGPWGPTPIGGYTRKLFDEIEAALKEKNT